MNNEIKQVYDLLTDEEKSIVKNYCAKRAFEEVPELKQNVASGQIVPNYEWLVDSIKNNSTTAKAQKTLIDMLDEKISKITEEEILGVDDLTVFIQKQKFEQYSGKVIWFYDFFESDFLNGKDMTPEGVATEYLRKTNPNVSIDELKRAIEDLKIRDEKSFAYLSASIVEQMYEDAYLSHVAHDMELKYSELYYAENPKEQIDAVLKKLDIINDITVPYTPEVEKNRIELYQRNYNLFAMTYPAVKKFHEKKINDIKDNKEMSESEKQEALEQIEKEKLQLGKVAYFEKNISFILKNDKKKIVEYKKRSVEIDLEYGRKKLRNPKDDVYVFRCGIKKDNNGLEARARKNEIQPLDHIAFGSTMTDSPYISTTISPIIAGTYMYEYNKKKSEGVTIPMIIDVKKIYEMICDRLDTIKSAKLKLPGEVEALELMLNSSSLSENTKVGVSNRVSQIGNSMSYAIDSNLPEEFFDASTRKQVVDRNELIVKSGKQKMTLVFPRSNKWANKKFNRMTYAERVTSYSISSKEVLFKGHIPEEGIRPLDQLTFDYIVSASSYGESNLAKELISKKIKDEKFNLTTIVSEFLSDSQKRIELGLSNQDLFFLDQYYLKGRKPEEILSVYNKRGTSDIDGKADSVDFEDERMKDLYVVAMRNNILEKLTRSTAFKERLVAEGVEINDRESISLGTVLPRKIHRTAIKFDPNNPRQVKVMGVPGGAQILIDTPYNQPYSVNTDNTEGVGISTTKYITDRDPYDRQYRRSMREEVFVLLKPTEIGKDYSALSAAMSLEDTKKKLDKVKKADKTKKKEEKEK